MQRSSPAVLIGLLVAAETVAGEPTNAPEPEIVVSASRDRRAAEQIPANVTVLTADDIAQADAVSLVDVLQNLDGIYFRSYSGEADQAEISMRGFGENSHGRVLILLDGRRLNRPDMAGINWAQIPLQNVERVEVLRGSQSALYGDYAIGGVINIITKQGAPTPAYSASALGGSYGLNAQRLGATGTAGPLSYAVNADRTQAQGYRDRSAYLNWGAGVNLGYDLNSWNTARLNLGYDRLDYQLPGGLSKAQMDADPRQSLYPDDHANNGLFNADLGFKSLWDDLLCFDLDLAYGRNDMTSDLASWQSFADVTIHSPSVTPRLTLTHEIGQHANTVLAGLDYYFDRLETERYTDEARQTEAADARIDKQTVGVYVRDEFSLLESLLLGLGARTEQARYTAHFLTSATNDANTHNANALEAALTWRFQDQSKVFARAGTVYRFPFVDEEISYIGYGPDQMYTDLKPEKGQNYELGTDVALPASIRLGATLFLLNMQNEIAYNGATYRNENLDDTRHQGAEVSAAWKPFEVCTLNAQYTYTEARFIAGDNDGCDVPLVPRHKAAFGLDYRLPCDLTARGTLTTVGPQYLGSDNANTGARLAQYTLVDLALRYAPHQLVRWGLEGFIGVDNVFDEQYAGVGYRGWDADYYYPSPTRTWKGGLACRF